MNYTSIGMVVWVSVVKSLTNFMMADTILPQLQLQNGSTPILYDILDKASWVIVQSVPALDVIKKRAWAAIVVASKAIKKVSSFSRRLRTVLNKAPDANILINLESLALIPLTYMWILETIVI